MSPVSDCRRSEYLRRVQSSVNADEEFGVTHIALKNQMRSIEAFRGFGAPYPLVAKSFKVRQARSTVKHQQRSESSAPAPGAAPGHKLVRVAVSCFKSAAS